MFEFVNDKNVNNEMFAKNKRIDADRQSIA